MESVSTSRGYRELCIECAQEKINGKPKWILNPMILGNRSDSMDTPYTNLQPRENFV